MNRKVAVRETMLEYAGDPFAWGVLDCCQFAAKVAEKITGTDFSKGFFYASEDDAEGIINSANGLENLVTKILGVDSVGVEFLDVGDPVLVDIPVMGNMIGVFNGNHAIIKLKQRAVLIEGQRILKGWHLG